MSGRLADKMLTLAPDCYGLPERALLMYLGMKTSEARRQVYVGQAAMIDALGVHRATLFRILAKLTADGLVVPLRNARAGTRQQYALMVDKDRPACGQHPSCTRARVAPTRPSGSHVRDPRPVREGRMYATPNGNRRLNGTPDRLAALNITELRPPRTTP